MNWRWLLLDFIPPEFELNRDQRREAKSHTARFQGGNLWLFLCYLTYCVIQISLIFTFVITLASGYRSTIGIVSLCLLITFAPVGIFFLLVIVLYRPLVLRALDLFMHLQGRCGKCGFDLRVLEDGDPGSFNCPECGNPRIPHSEVLRHSTCRVCGYNLKGLPDSSTLCPDCGTKRL